MRICIHVCRHLCTYLYYICVCVKLYECLLYSKNINISLKRVTLEYAFICYHVL